jgi:amino acid transporter
MKLKRELSFLDLFCIASGAMISSGLFVLPGLAYLKIGPAAFVAYFIAALIVLPAMFSKAELATAMPKAGGTYFFIDRSMGAGFGTLAGLAAWFSLSFKSAFALLGIGAFATLISPAITYWQIKLIAVFFCILFAFVNFLGIGHAGKLQIALVLGLVAILGFYIAKGLPLVNLEHFQSFMRGTPRELFATAGLIFISYGGLTKIASVAEEVKNPARNIPLGMLTSFFVVSTLYVATIFVTVGVLGDGLIKAPGQPSLTPISDCAHLFMGRWGEVLLAFGAILAFVSTGNAGIMAASRTPMAMSRDGLLPKFFENIHSKFKTPYHSIVFTSVFMMAIILFLDLEMLVKTASTMKILLFGAVNIAVIIMRESGIQNYRPKFKTPLYPWLQVIGLISYGFLLFEMGSIPLTIAGFFLGIGLLWYWLYGRIHAMRDSALMLLVRRITPKELTSYSLSEELREILLERDEVVADRFDILVRNALVLDLEGCLEMEDTFKTLAGSLAKRVDLSSEHIYELLMEREKDSSTIIAPGLAIPHIILPGEEKFEILLARCKDGIIFPPNPEPVHAMFVLAGTYDERNFHLKALMSIAKVVQKADFMKKWMKATSQEGLRDIVLLGEIG